jgi:tRNA(Arg) A34 adenosine deaminase TadA
MAADIWRECFALDWESFRAASMAVGAVLVAPGGRIVARGRNRLTRAGRRGPAVRRHRPHPHARPAS